MAITNHEKLLKRTNPDDIFLVTYPKSGTTWLRFLIGNYLTGNQCDFSNAHSIMPGLRNDQDTIPWCQFKPRFIQSHFNFIPEYSRHKVIYLVRDGRDVAVSYYFHLIKHWKLDKDTPFADFLTRFNDGSIAVRQIWSNHVINWLDNASDNLLLLRYEDLQTDTVGSLTKVLQYAGVSVDQEAIVSAVKASQFEQMQNLEKEQYKLSLSRLATSDPSIQFVRNGKSGDWQNYFTEELLTDFIQVHRQALEKLGYLVNNSLPEVRCSQNQQVITPSINLRTEKNQDYSQNVILTGVPRSGTTLSCSLLDRFPNTVALNEPPFKVADLVGLNNEERYQQIQNWFARSRESILTHKKLVSGQINAQEQDNTFSQHKDEKTGFRKCLVASQEIEISRNLAADFLLIIKKPILFTSILESLVGRFPIYVVMRNPLSVLASWHTLAHMKDRQNLAEEKLDLNLSQRLQPITDSLTRQIHQLSWYYEKYYQLISQVSVIRYEDIIATQGKALSVITPHALDLNENLENKNLNQVYDRDLMLTLGKKILEFDGGFWQFYTKEDVEVLLEKCLDNSQVNNLSLIEQAIQQLNANQNQKALELFEQAVEQKTQPVNINYGKAIALARLGKNSEAVAILKELLKIIPEHKKARLLLSHIS